MPEHRRRSRSRSRSRHQHLHLHLHHADLRGDINIYITPSRTRSRSTSARAGSGVSDSAVAEEDAEGPPQTNDQVVTGENGCDSGEHDSGPHDDSDDDSEYAGPGHGAGHSRGRCFDEPNTSGMWLRAQNDHPSVVQCPHCRSCQCIGTYRFLGGDLIACNWFPHAFVNGPS